MVIRGDTVRSVLWVMNFILITSNDNNLILNVIIKHLEWISLKTNTLFERNILS